MATIPAGAHVSLREEYHAALAFPPPADDHLYVAVHHGALNAGSANRLTQVISIGDREVTWVGALDERMLVVGDRSPDPDARMLLTWLLGRGRFGEIIWPGDLVVVGTHPQVDLYTVYQKSRPWVVVGALDDGTPIAAPLNDATNPLWFTPIIEEADILMPGPKRAQLELAHLWSFPSDPEARGRVSDHAAAQISGAIAAYFLIG